MADDKILAGKEQIQQYWEESIPWTFNDKPEVPFAEIREMRYDYHAYMHDVLPFSEMRDKTVVEVGAGAGVDAIEFARFGANVIAIEPTENGVETTREHADEAGVEIDVYQAGGEDMPLNDDVADLVYSFGVLHHIPDITPVMEEITRVMKPDGEFVGMVYNQDSLLNAYSIIYRHGVRDGGLNEHSPSELASLYSERNTGCPYTKLYTVNEAQETFGEWFDTVSTDVRYDVIDTDDKRKVKLSIPEGYDLGWHIIVQASGY